MHFISVLIQKKGKESDKTMHLTRKKEKFVKHFNVATKDHGFLLNDLKTNDGSFKLKNNFDTHLIKFTYTK